MLSGGREITRNLYCPMTIDDIDEIFLSSFLLRRDNIEQNGLTIDITRSLDVSTYQILVLMFTATLSLCGRHGCVIIIFSIVFQLP